MCFVQGQCCQGTECRLCQLHETSNTASVTEAVSFTNDVSTSEDSYSDSDGTDNPIHRTVNSETTSLNPDVDTDTFIVPVTTHKGRKKHKFRFT